MKLRLFEGKEPDIKPIYVKSINTKVKTLTIEFHTTSDCLGFCENYIDKYLLPEGSK